MSSISLNINDGLSRMPYGIVSNTNGSYVVSKFSIKKESRKKKIIKIWSLIPISLKIFGVAIRLGICYMISKIVSNDIMRYFQEKEKLSIEDIAISMDTTVEHINDIISKKTYLTGEDIDAYLASSRTRFWELAIKAIPLNHLSPKARDRILLCKEIDSYIKRRKF